MKCTEESKCHYCNMKCTEESKCPYCNSKNYKQVDDERKYEYPIMICKDCGKEFWSE